MHQFWFYAKFYLVLHSLLQRHLRNSYKNSLSYYWKQDWPRPTCHRAGILGDLISTSFRKWPREFIVWPGLDLIFYQYCLKLELYTQAHNYREYIHSKKFVRHNYNTESKIALKVFLSLFFKAVPQLKHLRLSSNPVVILEPLCKILILIFGHKLDFAHNRK